MKHTAQYLDLIVALGMALVFFSGVAAGWFLRKDYERRLRRK